MPVMEEPLREGSIVVIEEERMSGDCRWGVENRTGGTEMLLFSMTRVFRLLPEEQKQAFLEGLSEKAS
jgi:hypothetical protein